MITTTASVDHASKMSATEKDALINRLLNKNASSEPQRTGISSYAGRKDQLMKEARYEAVLAKNLSTASGLKKIAANLANPVR